MADAGSKGRVGKLAVGGGGGGSEEGDIKMKGYLDKKRSFGWLKRYFVLDKHIFAYYSSPQDQFPLHFISLKEIREVRLWPEKNSGRRFEVRLVNRVLTLLAESARAAALWVAALEDALKALSSADVEAPLQGRAPETPVDMLGDVEDLEGVPQEQTEFRLAFYKTALKRPDWLRKLMTHFRTDEQILRLVIQVLLDPHQEADTWFLLDDRPSTPSGLSAASPSASDMDDGNAPNPMAIFEAPKGVQRKLRSSGCTRHNPDAHKTSLTYKRAGHLNLNIIPNYARGIKSTVSSANLAEAAAAGGGGGGGAAAGPLKSPRSTDDFVLQGRGGSIMDAATFTISLEAVDEKGDATGQAPSSARGVRKPAHTRDKSVALALALPRPRSASPSPDAGEQERHRRQHSTVTGTGSHSPRSPHRRSSSNYHLSVSRDDLALPARQSSKEDGPNFFLTATGYATIDRVDKQNIYDWAVSDDFLGKTMALFAGADFAAQRLALRVLWILVMRVAHTELADLKNSDSECPECRRAADQFAELMVKIHTGFCPPLLLNHQVNNTVNALLAILVMDMREFNRDAKDPSRFNIFGKDVRNYGVWKAAFTSLNHAEFHTRRRAIKDLNGVLIHRPHNCESLLAQSGWQSWVLPLLVDIPRQAMGVVTVENTYKFTVNVFTLLHFHCFVNHSRGELSFENVLRASLLAPLRLKDNKVHLMRSFLLAITRKVRFHHREFQLQFEGCLWTNLRVLLRYIKSFIFSTPPRRVESDSAGELYSEGGEEKEVRLGLHGEEDVAEDLTLIDATLELLSALKLESLEISDMVHGASADERAAFEALKRAGDEGFFRDATVFVPLVVGIRELSDKEVYELVRDFLQAEGEGRRKVFKAAQERHKDVVELQRKLQKQRNEAIERELAKSNRKEQNVKSVLLLGAGESGKSTLFKQMIAIYGSGFPERERKPYKPLIHENTINAMQRLCEESDRIPGASLISPASVEARAALAKLEAPLTVTRDVARHITTLWADPCIRLVYDQRAKFQLASGDSAQHYFNKVVELANDSYVPTLEDVLRSRMRTTGVVEQRFVIEGVEFKLTDVGGQRSERKKWIHQFQDVTCVLFVAALSEYDQVIEEDGKTNRVEEALNLFGEIINGEWFRRTPIILFLNKSDLFEYKLTRVPLAQYFPAFQRYRQDFRTACAFMQREFHRKNAVRNREIYTHFTCATDTNHIRLIFNSVKDIIINDSLRRGGLLDDV